MEENGKNGQQLLKVINKQCFLMIQHSMIYQIIEVLPNLFIFCYCNSKWTQQSTFYICFSFLKAYKHTHTHTQNISNKTATHKKKD